jgi:hypothetical protein
MSATSTSSPPAAGRSSTLRQTTVSRTAERFLAIPV